MEVNVKHACKNIQFDLFFLWCSSCSPTMPLTTFCPSPPSWWRGWRRGSSTLRFSLRKPKMKEVRINRTSETQTQQKSEDSFCFISLPSSGERSLRASPHDLPPRRFRRAVLLPAGIDRRWSSGGNIFRTFSRFELIISSLCAGSEEELDEEGLGRKAVTAQVSGPSPPDSVCLKTAKNFYYSCRRRSTSDKGRRPCLWWSRSSTRRKTGNLRKTTYAHLFTASAEDVRTLLSLDLLRARSAAQKAFQ